jgi:hypothetical protein
LCHHVRVLEPSFEPPSLLLLHALSARVAVRTAAATTAHFRMLRISDPLLTLSALFWPPFLGVDAYRR